MILLTILNQQLIDEEDLCELLLIGHQFQWQSMPYIDWFKNTMLGIGT